MKYVLFALLLLLNIGMISAMNQPTGIVKLKDSAGNITLKDLTTNFWVKYYPNEDTYEGFTNRLQGTFQEGFGDSPTEMARVEPTQPELKDYYDLLNSQLKERLE